MFNLYKRLSFHSTTFIKFLLFRVILSSWGRAKGRRRRKTWLFKNLINWGRECLVKGLRNLLNAKASFIKLSVRKSELSDSLLFEMEKITPLNFLRFKFSNTLTGVIWGGWLVILCIMEMRARVMQYKLKSIKYKVKFLFNSFKYKK